MVDGGVGGGTLSLAPLNPRCNKLPNVYLRRIFSFNIICTSSLITQVQLGAEQKYTFKQIVY